MCCVYMKVNKKISLQYPLIKGTILIEETDSTHYVSSMPFFNIVPLKGEALFMVCDMLVHPRCVEHVSLFHQPHNSSMFYVFIRGECTPSRQETDENHWVPRLDCMGDGQSFPNWNLREVPSLLCHVQSCIVMKKNHTITKKTGHFLVMACRKLLSMAEHLSALNLSA